MRAFFRGLMQVAAPVQAAINLAAVAFVAVVFVRVLIFFVTGK